jgi:hypothetical protein
MTIWYNTISGISHFYSEQVSIHQHFTYTRCFGSLFYVHLTREKLQKRRSYEKFVHKMLMKLTVGEILFVCF